MGMKRPIRRTSDDWSVITTAHLPAFLAPTMPLAGVLQLSLDEGTPPNYIPPRMVPNDQRVHPRREIRSDIQVTLAGQELRVHGHDVSAGGMCCGSFPYWARRGDPILLQLPGTEHHILGRVVWVRREFEIDDEQLAGIRFTSPQRGLHILD